MEQLSTESLMDIWATAQAWAVAHLFTLNTLLEVAGLALSLLMALVLRRRVAAWFAGKRRNHALWPSLRRSAAIAEPLTFPMVGLLGLWLAVLLLASAGYSVRGLNILSSLLTAWVVIRLAAGIMRGGYWVRLLAVIVWVVAALNITGLLDPTLGILDGLALTLGEVRISVLSVIKGLISAGVLLWVALAVSRFVETRLHRSRHLTPSIQVLSAKMAKILLIVVAVVIALSAMGIDLTAFAVFGGAVGVGIGFGLQKVVSNLVSGVILLLDRSIKPGDVIELGGAYGWINTLGARYVSVVTRDGMEYLIPNEDLITQRVINWSFSSRKIRLKVPIGISYDSDVHQAIALIKEAAGAEERVLDDPPPNCLMRGFGDSALDLELRFWITDPENGAGNIQSAVLLRIWDKFQEYGIQIPYPHREVILRRETSPEAEPPQTS